MVPASFRFFEMKEEELRTDSTEFDEAKFGIAPKALDPVHMVFTARKFVLVVVDAPVFVAAQQQAVVAEPSRRCRRWFWKAPVL